MIAEILATTFAKYGEIQVKTTQWCTSTEKYFWKISTVWQKKREGTIMYSNHQLLAH